MDFDIIQISSFKEKHSFQNVWKTVVIFSRPQGVTTFMGVFNKEYYHTLSRIYHKPYHLTINV